MAVCGKCRGGGIRAFMKPGKQFFEQTCSMIARNESRGCRIRPEHEHRLQKHSTHTGMTVQKKRVGIIRIDQSIGRKRRKKTSHMWNAIKPSSSPSIVNCCSIDPPTTAAFVASRQSMRRRFLRVLRMMMMMIAGEIENRRFLRTTLKCHHHCFS